MTPKHHLITDSEILKNLGVTDPRVVIVSITARSPIGCFKESQKFLDANEKMIEKAKFSAPKLHEEAAGFCYYSSGLVTFKLRRVA